MDYKSIFLFALLLTWHLGYGNSPVSDTLELPTVEAKVTAPKAEAFRLVLDENQLRHYRSLQDALQSIPGFHIRQESGLGGYSYTRFRGSSAAQVSVSIDGISLNSAAAPVVDLGKISLTDIGRLEVETQAQALGNGSAVKVNLSTKRVGSQRLRFMGSMGSFATQQGSCFLKAGNPNLYGHLSTTIAQSENSWPYYSENGTGVNKEDNQNRNMTNNQFDSKSFYASLTLPKLIPQSPEILLNGFLNQSKKEWPGVNPRTSYAYTRGLDWALGSKFIYQPIEIFSSQLSINTRSRTDEWRDPGSSMSSGGIRSFKQDRFNNNLNIQFQNSLQLSDLNSDGLQIVPSLQIEWNCESMHNEVDSIFSNYAIPKASRSKVNAAPGLNIEYHQLELNAHSALQFQDFAAIGSKKFPWTPRDTMETRDLNFTYDLELNWIQLEKDSSFSLAHRLSWAETTREPGFTEFFGDNNGVSSNLELKAEKSRMLTFESRLSRKNIRLIPSISNFQAVYSIFYHHISNLIRLEPLGSSQFLRNVNAPLQSGPGQNMLLQIVFPKLSFQSSTSYSKIRIQEDASQTKKTRAAWSPDWEQDLLLTLKPYSILELNLIAHGKGDEYVSDQNLPIFSRSSQWLYHSSAILANGNWLLEFQAFNLFDKQYSDLSSLPASGRSYQLNLKLAFR